MAKEDRSILTRLELRMMQVIWRDGTSSVTAVQTGLTQELAYTTVQTMLNILVRKGHLRRKLHGRAFLYSAAVTEASATGNALRDLLDRMFGGSGEQLVMALIKDRQIDAKTLAELTERLAQVSDEASGGPGSSTEADMDTSDGRTRNE